MKEKKKKNVILGWFYCSLYSFTGGWDLKWKFLSDLYCTLFTLPPLSLLFSPLHILPKAIVRGFLVLFHTVMWSSSTIYHHLNLFPSPSPFPLVPPNYTHCAYFTVLVFVINIYVDIQRGVSMYAHCGYPLFWAV
jgi:hypothetical protein